MEEATIALTLTSLSIFAVFTGLFIWGLKSGQFRNIEEPKYRMLELENIEDEERRKKDARVDNKDA
jgi:cbb3-type cytochrome oxidase maturation protein